MSHSNTWGGKNISGAGGKNTGAEGPGCLAGSEERPQHPSSTVLPSQVLGNEVALAHHSTLSSGRPSLPSEPLVNLHPTITILCPGLFPADL